MAFVSITNWEQVTLQMWEQEGHPFTWIHQTRLTQQFSDPTFLVTRCTLMYFFKPLCTKVSPLDPRKTLELSAAENSTDLTTVAYPQKGLILIHRSLKTNIPGWRWQLQEVIRPPCFFYFSVLPHVASHLRVNSWNMMAAGPPAIAATFQAMGSRVGGRGLEQGCVCGEIPPSWRTLPRIPTHISMDISGRTSRGPRRPRGRKQSFCGVLCQPK